MNESNDLVHIVVHVGYQFRVVGDETWSFTDRDAVYFSIKDRIDYESRPVYALDLVRLNKGVDNAKEKA